MEKNNAQYICPLEGQPLPACSSFSREKSTRNITELKLKAVSILCLVCFICLTHEMDRNTRLMQVIHSCVNEKGFVYTADVPIGILCFRDQ